MIRSLLFIAALSIIRFPSHAQDRQQLIPFHPDQEPGLLEPGDEKIDGEIPVTKQRMVHSTKEQYDYNHDTEEMDYGETDSVTYVYGAYRGTTPETNKPDTVYDYTEIGGDLYNTGFYEYNDHNNVTYYQSDNADGALHSERTVTYFDGIKVQRDTFSQVTEDVGLYLCVENDAEGNETYDLRIQDAPGYPSYYNYKWVYWRTFEDGGRKTYQLLKFRYFVEEAGSPGYDEYSYYNYGAFETPEKDSIIRVFYEALDSTAVDYVNEYITTRTFDSDGNVLTLIRTMNGSYTTKYIYTYDDNGNVLTRIGQSFESGAWVNSTRIDYEYDSDGRESLREDYEWIDGAFVRYHLYVTAYNEDGYEVLKETYDTKEYLVSILGEDDYIFEEDNYIDLRTITYRNEINNPDSVLSVLNNYNSPAEPGTVLENIPEHHIMNRYYYVLYEDPTGVSELERTAFVIYPNPVTHSVYISNTGLESIHWTLYDILGKEVQSRKNFESTDREQIDLERFNPGNYLLLIRDHSGRQFTYPIVKQ